LSHHLPGENPPSRQQTSAAQQMVICFVESEIVSTEDMRKPFYRTNLLALWLKVLCWQWLTLVQDC